MSNPNAFLKANKYVEVADSSYCYLLNIKEYLPSGSVEPYDYASSHVTEMLVNQRKVEFLKKFEESEEGKQWKEEQKRKISELLEKDVEEEDTPELFSVEELFGKR